jgi:hypothetical protein
VIRPTHALLRKELLRPTHADSVPKALVVFVDIGGNREIEALVALIPWLETSLPQQPRLVVVKSQTLCAAAIAAPLTVERWTHLKAQSRAAVAQRRAKEGGRLNASPRLPNALKMPLRKTTDGKPICRFFNYSPQRCRKGGMCPYDHAHCHACGLVGHHALICDLAMPLI